MIFPEYIANHRPARPGPGWISPLMMAFLGLSAIGFSGCQITRSTSASDNPNPVSAQSVRPNAHIASSQIIGPQTIYVFYNGYSIPVNPAGTSGGGGNEGVSVPQMPQVVDSSGNVWTLSSGQVYENGNAVAGVSSTSSVLFLNGTVYVNTAGGWFSYTGTGWAAQSGDPRGANYQPYIASSNDILAGWPVSNLTDMDTTTSYSSNIFPSSANSRGTYVQIALGSAAYIDTVNMTARMYNLAMAGFPLQYGISVLASDGVTWNQVGTYTRMPDINGALTVNIGGPYLTAGVRVTPTILGADPNGNHYFQLADLQVASSLAPIKSIVAQDVSSPGLNPVYTTDVLAGSPVSNMLDGNPQTAYSSNPFSTMTNYRTLSLTAYLANPSVVNQIVLKPRTVAGQVAGFPQQYDLQYRNGSSEQWYDLGTFSQQPNGSNVVIPLSGNFNFDAFKITPIVLGADTQNGGQYYFQLAEIGASYNPMYIPANYVSGN